MFTLALRKNMEKRWVWADEPDKEQVAHVEGVLGVSALLAKLLVQCGVRSFDEAHAFFRPDLNHLHDPFLMKDMDKAINRIVSAISAQEKVLIYGDYDVDGTTAVSLVYTFFRQYLKNIDYYIPNRYTEGYGVSTAGVDYAAANGYSLIIALDCGIKSIDKVAYAQEKGVDFIICDHHLPGEEIPAAVAVLDPKRKDCAYPFDELCGCGIGFKLIQAFAIQHDVPTEMILPYLDLVAVSIASDIVPVTGENRTLAFLGLKQLNEAPRPGLKALIEASGKSTLSISDIVFSIGPRINAAGRIDDAKQSVHLLIADTKVMAEQKSAIVNTKNDERRNVDSAITAEALAMIENDSSLLDRKSTVLYNSSWNKGVIGIVASRLIEKYYRPTIVLTESNGKAAGSARSVSGFNVYDAIDACSDLLEQFGGHKYAAGLTLPLENVPAFQQRFEDVVSATIDEKLLIQEVNINAKVELKEINPKFVRILNQFAPFGPGNMKPVFVSDELNCVYDPQVVGNNHLKMTVKQEGSSSFECIGFGLGEFASSLRKGRNFSMAYTIDENEWNGKKTVQLSIRDIRLQA